MVFIGNKSSKELHQSDCFCVKRMSLKNKIKFSTIEKALTLNYDGCGHCLDLYNEIAFQPEIQLNPTLKPKPKLKSKSKPEVRSTKSKEKSRAVDNDVRSLDIEILELSPVHIKGQIKGQIKGISKKVTFTSKQQAENRYQSILVLSGTAYEIDLSVVPGKHIVRKINGPNMVTNESSCQFLQAAGLALKQTLVDKYKLIQLSLPVRLVLAQCKLLTGFEKKLAKNIPNTRKMSLKETAKKTTPTKGFATLQTTENREQIMRILAARRPGPCVYKGERIEALFDNHSGYIIPDQWFIIGGAEGTDAAGQAGSDESIGTTGWTYAAVDHDMAQRFAIKTREKLNKYVKPYLIASDETVGDERQKINEFFDSIHHPEFKRKVIFVILDNHRNKLQECLLTLDTSHKDEVINSYTEQVIKKLNIFFLPMEEYGGLGLHSLDEFLVAMDDYFYSLVWGCTG